MISITGEGGIGKTRLALVVAERVRPAFPDGVWFVPLAGMDHELNVPAAPTESAALSERLAAAIAKHLSLQRSLGASVLDQLTQRLSDWRALLLLDNFEHLHGAAQLLVELLDAAPGLRLLVTSRHRLDLQSEYTFRLGGLPIPPIAADSGQFEVAPADLGRLSSVQLFVERADRRSGGFVLSEHNEAAVGRICQLTEGMPLAIELAAALTDQHSCHDIANAIAATVDTLATSMADLAPRHRSLRAVFEYSWQLLAQDEQAVLARCAVFRSGFIPAAATAVAGASPEILASLVDKSLLRCDGTARYDMHELLRQLGAEKLLNEPDAAELMQKRHCTYFAQFLESMQDLLSDDPALIQAAQTEIDNLNTAWETAVRQVDLTALRQMAIAITQIWYGRGLIKQADIWFAEAVSAVRAALHQAEEVAEIQAVLGRLLYLQSVFSEHLSKLTQGIAQAQEALQLSRLLGDSFLEAECNMRLAAMYWTLGDLQATEDAARRGLELAAQFDNTHLRIMGQGSLSSVMLSRGQLDAARELDKQTLALAQAAGRRRLAGVLMNKLGTAYHALGDFHKARTLLDQGLEIRREISDQAGVSSALLYSGLLCLTLGDQEGARQRLEEAQALFAALDSVDGHARALAYGALACLGLQATEDAFHRARQALALASHASVFQTLALAHLVQARIQRAQGQLDGGLDACSAALAQAGKTPETEAILAAQAVQADILAAQGDWPAAYAVVQQMLPLPKQISFMPVLGNIDAYLVAGQILASVDQDQAQAILQRVHERLLAAAATIDDAEARHRFLYGVTSHRRVMEAVAAGCF